MSDPVIDRDDDDDDVTEETPRTGLALRDPRTPATLDDLAALRGAAVEVLESRIVILETARKRAIRMTHPEDWVLFKSPDERITGYLQDAGCDRVRDILSIEVFGVSTPEKILAVDGQSFIYVQHGSGRSRLTLQTVEDMEGGRGSTEDFCKDATGAQLELLVRKATRANLDGNITRELAGLKNVPLEALQEGWQGTTKRWEHCRKGRGFGSQAERMGATREGVPDVPPPTCPVCKAPDGSPLPLQYRPASGTRKAFYGCRNYGKHPQQKVIVDAAQWIAQAEKAAREHQTDARAQAAENNRIDAAIAQDDRQPGEEG